MRTKLFFDTEFTGLHKDSTLISLGIEAESGETFYAEFTDYNKSQVDGWIQENVISNLLFNDFSDSGIITNCNPREFSLKANSLSIKEQLTKWLEQFKYDGVEMWSDCLAYDWVLFCQLWGHAFNIPNSVYYIPFDICTLFKAAKIDPDVSRETFAFDDNVIYGYFDIINQTKPLKKHNALWDAKVIQKCYNRLQLYL